MTIYTPLQPPLKVIKFGIYIVKIVDITVLNANIVNKLHFVIISEIAFVYITGLNFRNFFFNRKKLGEVVSKLN